MGRLFIALFEAKKQNSSRRRSIFAGILVFYLSMPLCAFAQGVQFQWSYQIGDGGEATGRSIAVDPDGNILVAGYFSGSAVIGSNILRCARSFNPATFISDSDTFLAKYAPAGNVLWARQSGGVGASRLYDLAVDSHGNSYVSGSFCCGTTTFGNTTLTALSNTDIDTYLAKYDKQGNLVWVQNHRSINIRQENLKVTVDREDNLYLMGSFSGDVSFGAGVSISSHGLTDIFLVKYDSVGTALWARGFGSPRPDYANAVSTDAERNVYVTGYLSDVADFGGGNLVNPTMFVAEFDSAGNLVRATDATGGGPVGVNGKNNLYLAGGPLNASAFFLEKYDTGFGRIWRTEAHSSSLIIAQKFSFDMSGNVYLIGEFRGTADFGVTNLVSSSTNSFDLFICKYDASGKMLSLAQVPMNNTFAYPTIATNPDGVGYITGNSYGRTCFGSNCFYLSAAFLAAVQFPRGTIAISEQPQNQIVRVGTGAVFRVKASSEEPLSYQWQFAGIDLANDARISGATSSVLTIADVQLSDMGFYNVIIKNDFVSKSSEAVTLSVVPLRLSGPVRREDGRWQYSFPTQNGETYFIEASTDLQDWTELFGLVGNGQALDFLDSNGINFPFRFYRFKLE
jgi:hypothetical protein